MQNVRYLLGPCNIALTSEGQKLLLNYVLPFHWKVLARLLKLCTRSTSLNAATLSIPSLSFTHSSCSPWDPHLLLWLMRKEGMGLWYICIYASVCALVCRVSISCRMEGNEEWWHFVSSHPVLAFLADCSHWQPLLSASSKHVCLSPFTESQMGYVSSAKGRTDFVSCVVPCLYSYFYSS